MTGNSLAFGRNLKRSYTIHTFNDWVALMILWYYSMTITELHSWKFWGRCGNEFCNTLEIHCDLFQNYHNALTEETITDEANYMVSKQLHLFVHWYKQMLKSQEHTVGRQTIMLLCMLCTTFLRATALDLSGAKPEVVQVYVDFC